jgi:hypothetical protein
MLNELTHDKPPVCGFGWLEPGFLAPFVSLGIYYLRVINLFPDSSQRLVRQCLCSF